MKRWIAGILAAALLLAAVPAGAQETSAGTAGTLAENLRFLREMAENEDVRSLIQIQDVQDLMSEVVARVLIWMIQNRPVTMEILAELGVGETDLRCIGKLWDSAERIRDAWQAYSETEDGRRLAAEAEAAANDPELGEALKNFMDMLSQQDISAVCKALMDNVLEGFSEEFPAGAVTDEAVERQINRSTLTGSLFLRLISLVQDSEWAQSSLPVLMENENRWNLIIHLSETDWLNDVLQEEGRKLAEDPEMSNFVTSTAEGLVSLIRDHSGQEPADSGTGKEDTP